MSQPTLTKAALAAHLQERLGTSRREAGELVDAILRILQATLVAGERVRISGFGSFEVRDRPARMGRNPRTNEPVRIPRRRVVSFKPSPKLRQALNPGRGKARETTLDESREEDG